MQPLDDPARRAAYALLRLRLLLHVLNRRSLPESRGGWRNYESVQRGCVTQQPGATISFRQPAGPVSVSLANPRWGTIP
jgi:hypothetical protein